MSQRSKTWIGVDPGGAGNFGLAILEVGGNCHSTTMDSVDKAIAVVREFIDDTPAGVGVDAPLWWSSGNGGLRQSDQWIRDHYRLHHRHVQAVNSLWGSVLAQGMMFVARMRELFPQVRVTETHPKAVLAALGRGPWEAKFHELSTKVTLDTEPDHERDAIISAIAAREGFEGDGNEISLITAILLNRTP